MRGLKILSLIILSLLGGFSATTSVWAAEDLLTNPDFEDFSEETPKGWLRNYSTLTTSPASESGQIHSGAKAVIFKSSSSSTKYLYQVIPISSEQYYHFAGWQKIISGLGSSYLRVTQCSDSNCTQEIGSFDSTHETANDWKNLVLDFKSSANARSAKFKLSLDPTGANAIESVWDQLTLTKTDQTVSDSSTDQTNAGPKIDFSLPSNSQAGQEYLLPITITNVSQGSYFIKCRIGPDSNHLTHGQTFNNNWLNDNDSWIKFPKIIAGPNSAWQGSLKIRLSESSPGGSYQLVVRIKKETTDQFLESDLKTLSFSSASVKNAVSLATTTQPASNNGNSSFKVNKSLADDKLDPSANILGLSTNSSQTSAAQSLPPSTPSSNPILIQPKKSLNSWPPIRDVFIGFGLFLAGFGGTVFWRNRH